MTLGRSVYKIWTPNVHVKLSFSAFYHCVWTNLHIFERLQRRFIVNVAIDFWFCDYVHFYQYVREGGWQWVIMSNFTFCWLTGVVIFTRVRTAVQVRDMRRVIRMKIWCTKSEEPEEEWLDQANETDLSAEIFTSIVLKVVCARRPIWIIVVSCAVHV